MFSSWVVVSIHVQSNVQVPSATVSRGSNAMPKIEQARGTGDVAQNPDSYLACKPLILWSGNWRICGTPFRKTGKKLGDSAWFEADCMERHI
jgi:hypothetical protein